ncbi:solute carrier family 28 member 3-like [Lycodopsis pacificus]
MSVQDEIAVRCSPLFPRGDEGWSAYVNDKRMELDGIERKSQTRGKDNKAFESEVSETSFLLEKNIEPFQCYLAEQEDQIRLIIHLVLAAGFVAIVIAACVLNFNRAVELLVISLVTVIFLAWDWMMKRYGDRVWEELSPIRDLLGRNWFWIRWIVCVSLLVAVVGWLALDTAKRGTRQLVSFVGLLLLIFFMLMLSKHPFGLKWCWQTLLCGIGLQFVFGLLILRTTFGLVGLEWLGKKAKVLSYSSSVLYIPDLPCPHFLSTEFINANVTSSLQLVTCCTQLYNSVTVYEPWNVTFGEGFSHSNAAVHSHPPTHFNCSLVL